MNVFNKVTLQSMKNSRTRTIVTIIGVALSAAMITAVATFGVSLLHYMVKGATARYGDWHAGFLDVDAAFVQERVNDAAVSHLAAIEDVGYATLAGGQNPDKPYLFIAGYTDEAAATAPVNLLYGRMPQNNSELVVSGRVETDGGVKLKVGDILTLTLGTRTDGSRKLGQHDPIVESETLVPNTEKTFTVVGICQRPAFEEGAVPFYTGITKADSECRGNSFNAFVTLKNPRKASAYAKSLAGDGSYFLNDYVLRFMGASPNDKVFTALLYAIGSIVVAITMLGSIFLIYNAFNISLNERTRQFGILSSVGATARQLRNSVLFEGLCIGAIGIPIGVVIGIVAIRFVISVLAADFASFAYGSVPLTMTVSAPAIAGAAAVSVVTILISAYIPARKAANTPVMESIRQINEIKIDTRAVKTSKLAERLFGLEGTLALKNFKRNKKRYRSIVLSLTLSVVLFISVSSFAAEMKQASEMANVFTTYDIALVTDGMDDDEIQQLYDQLKTVGGVSKSMRQAVARSFFCTVKASDLSDYYRETAGYTLLDEIVSLPVELQFIEDDVYFDMIRELGLSQEEYAGVSGKMIAIAVISPPDMEGRTKELEDFFDLFSSSTQEITLTQKTNSALEIEKGQHVGMTFVRIVAPDSPPISSNKYEPQLFYFTALAPYSSKDRYVTEDALFDVQGITFRSENPSQSMAEMEEIIRLAEVTSPYQLLNLNKVLEDNRSMGFVVNVFTYMFIIMISLIAVANVFNTISTNIKLRKREFAMLRSVGMSDRDFYKMMNYECVFFGLKTLLFGLPIAGIVSWLIYKGMYMGGAENIDYLFPWNSMLISVLGVFLIVFVTTRYAVGKIKKENIIDALRDDMT